MQSPNERRRERSQRMCEAAHLQLASCTSRFQVEALSVADERGLIVARSSPDARCEVLAAHAPLLARSRDRQSRQAVYRSMAMEMPRSGLRRISVREFIVDGQSLFLCAIGQRTDGKEAAMQKAVNGLRRILAG